MQKGHSPNGNPKSMMSVQPLGLRRYTGYGKRSQSLDSSPIPTVEVYRGSRRTGLVCSRRGEFNRQHHRVDLRSGAWFMTRKPEDQKCK